MTNPLNWNNEIWKASRDHTLDTGPQNITGHTGSDGSQPFDRAKRYCDSISSFGENLSYGRHTAIDVLSQLIIDDGVPSRGHRANIFNPDWE